VSYVSASSLGGLLRRRFSARALPWSAVAAAALVGFAVYLGVGTPLVPGQRVQAPMAAARDLDLPTLFARIERHLADNPRDGHGWEALVPAHVQTGPGDDDVRAWRNAVEAHGATPERLAKYGEALVMAAQGVVGIEARQAFEAALAAAPGAPLPRFYLAMAAEQEGDWQDAAARWRQLVADAPAQASWRRAAVQRLAAAEWARGRQAPAPTTNGVAASVRSVPELAAGARRTEEQHGDSIAAMVERLEARLAADGQDLDGWLRLARSRSVMGNPGAAQRALASARRHFPDDAGAAARIEATARELGLES